MSRMLVTYSALDLAGTIVAPFVGPIDLSGMSQRGLAHINVSMTTDQSVLQVAADGAVVPSVVPGDLGIIEIECWQTSILHDALLAWYNAIKAARDQGDVSQWFAATILLQGTVSGRSHSATGCAPMKIGDTPYAEQAGRITWRIVCANLVQE